MNKQDNEEIEEIEEERVKSIESGFLSEGNDLAVAQQDASLYKHSLWSLHMLTHLPKDPNCPICNRAKMLFAPARKKTYQSQFRQDSQKRFEAREPYDLLFMDLKIIEKGAKGKIHEASFNILDAWTGASRTYRLTKHDSNAIRKCLTHFAGKKAGTYIIRGHSDNAGEITKACDELGWISEPTAANRPVHNPFAEKNIQTVTYGGQVRSFAEQLASCKVVVRSRVTFYYSAILFLSLIHI